MRNIKIEEIENFLEKNPQMSFAPSSNDEYVLKGSITLNITNEAYETIQDKFLIKIVVPKCFPKVIPTIYELGDRFPKTMDYHTFPSDSSLCLGSPMSLMKRIKENPTLEGYFQNCVVPYFYAIALKLKGQNDFVFGELEHGPIGILQDYIEVFELQNIVQAIQLLRILCEKPNKGNKMTCPCGCNRIVTRCSIHKKIIIYRDVLPRRVYRQDKEIFHTLYEGWKKDQKKNQIQKLIRHA